MVSLLLWYQAIKKISEKILKLLLLGNTVKYDDTVHIMSCSIVNEITMFTSTSRIILSLYHASRSHCQAKWTIDISEIISAVHLHHWLIGHTYWGS